MFDKAVIKFIAIIFIAILAGCAEREDKVFARIDFSSSTYPEIVSEITGLSAQAPWGRWSDANIAPSVTIHFRKTLPTKFVLAINGQTLRESDSATIKVGQFEQKVLLTSRKNEIVEVFVENAEPSQAIEIAPERPTSPKELGLNEDLRRLGIGFVEVVIFEN